MAGLSGLPGDAFVGDSLQVGVSKLGQTSVWATMPPGSAVVGFTLQVGVSLLAQTYKPHYSAPLAATAALSTGTGLGMHVGQAAPLGAVAGLTFDSGHQVRTRYRPDALQLFTAVGGSTVGIFLKVGASRLGRTDFDLTEITHVSGIQLTDGYNVSGDDNILSIDPLTGSATISDRIHPHPGDRVETAAGHHDMRAGDSWEVHYAGTIVAQGIVLQVETRMSTVGQYWTKKTDYALGGSASRMLNVEASWLSLPAEGALTRLRRFIPSIDLSLCTTDQRAYLDTVIAPAEDDAGSSTLLDLARAFSDQTKFPVRTANNVPGAVSAVNLIVVPAVTFRGLAPPLLYLPPAKTWTVDADFLSELDAATTEKLQTVEVMKNFDAFISGVSKQAMAGGQLGMSLILGQTRVGGVGGSLTVDVGVRAPVVVKLFGDTKVISQIKHEFTSEDYRSSLEITVPAVI